ncbi:MAG: hypothetical protein OXG94_10330 [Bacteroidetes bacterium]|nr:hypothetical protein [Bacteroidota bacterium]
MGRELMRNMSGLVGVVVLFLYLITPPQTTAQQSEGNVAKADWKGLKALYNATEGEYWKNNTNWDVHSEYPPSIDHLATWYGVIVSEGRVTELNLSDNGLAGILPAELGNISKLQVLDLQENDLSGSVGSWIGMLTALGKLHLQQNHLSGLIPDELGNLIHLEYLNLRGNQLEGAVPKSLGNLLKLQGLWLHANQLSGTIPQDILELPDLKWLWLGENPGLSDIIPITNSHQATKIDFYLGQTDLCIDRMITEVVDDLVPESSTSEYACLLKEEWNALKKLYFATDGNNWIANTGWNFEHRPRAESVGQWYGVSVDDGHIRALRLDLNHLDGLLPPDLGSLTELEILRVDGNPLYGPIPEELSLLQDLKVFSSSKTQLCTPKTTTTKLWLEQIPTVLGLPDCNDQAPMPIERAQERMAALPIWLIVGLGILGALGIGAALITALMNNGRPKNLEEETVDIDQSADQLTVIEERLNAFIHETASISTLAQQFIDQSEIAKDFSSTLKTLRTALDERDQEIKRLKQGHDNAVFRKFVIRFIRVDQAVQYFLKNAEEDSTTHLGSIHSLLEDALRECDVQSFHPEIGSDYRSAFGVAEYPKIIATTTIEDDCQIAEIMEPGYTMQGGKEKEVLIPARVAIYRFKPEV